MCGEDFPVSPTTLRASILKAIGEIKDVEGCLQEVMQRLDYCFESSRRYKIWMDVGSRLQVDTDVVKSLHATWGRPLAKGKGENNAECSHAMTHVPAFIGP